jgi:predicted nucleic acid-binding protein
MHYLDTSVLTGYYCIEERSERVQRVLSAMETPTISPLVEVEFYCAVARKVRAGALDKGEAVRIFSEFQMHLAEPRYCVLPIDTSHYVLAREWLAELVTPLRVLDALHLAAVSSAGLCIVTADRDLARCAEHFGVECQLIS